METFLKAIGAFFVIALIVVAIGFLLAYPTMWAMNYLFAASFMTFVFGSAKIGFWQAVVLNFISGWLIKSTTTTTSKD